MTRQVTPTLRTPQALSYAQAVSSNKETIDDFFAKLGATFGLIAKPSKIFNADETGLALFIDHRKLLLRSVGAMYHL